jgi:hypothetical protein
MKVVGTRHPDARPLIDQGPMARTAALLRGTSGVAPKGVYRFTSFDEAESWMNTAMRRSRALRSLPISSASAGR